MKKLIALSLAILLLTGCGAAVYEGPTEPAWVRTDSVITQYIPDTGEAQTLRRTDSYDCFGNQVRTCFYVDGELESEHKRTFDDRGNCIREVLWKRLWFFSYPQARTDYTYDEQNRRLTTTYRNGIGWKTGSDTYTYDDAARTITWEGTYDTQTKYLDENGNVIRTVTFSEATQTEMESQYEYDALGRHTKTTSYVDGEHASTTERRYDDQGWLLEHTILTDAGAVLTRTTYRYEGNTVTSWDEQGSRSIQILRPDGQVETAETYNPDGTLRTRTENIYTQIQIPAKEE